MKKENSLQYFCEHQDRIYLLQEWDQEKNAPLTPDTVHKGSHQKVWWNCSAGHAWQAEVRSRSGGSRCPYCTRRVLWVGDNDLAAVNPVLAAQWDTEKNGQLNPTDVLSGSERCVWWQCTLGHEWQAIVAARAVENSGCPYCAGRRVLAGFNDLATLFPTIAAQWDDTLNNGLAPEMVTLGSHKRVWWRCSEGHVWKAAVYSRTGKQKCGCPVCAGKTKQHAQYVRS